MFTPSLTTGTEKTGSGSIPDSTRGHEEDLPQRFPLFVKRGLDVLGSLAGLLTLSPVFLIIALGVKLTSKGPVLFRQERVDRGARPSLS